MIQFIHITNMKIPHKYSKEMEKLSLIIGIKHEKTNKKHDTYWLYRASNLLDIVRLNWVKEDWIVTFFVEFK